MVSWCPLFGVNFALKSYVGFCPLSGIEKRPPLGGYVSIKVMLDTIRNTTVVRCREAVLFSEGPLSEARLYIQAGFIEYNACEWTFVNHLMGLCMPTVLMGFRYP